MDDQVIQTTFTYDRLNGERCSGTVIIDCSKALIGGQVTNRELNEDTGEYEDVVTFNVGWGNQVYGKVDMTADEFISLCQQGCCDDADGAGLFAPEFEDTFE